MTNSTIQDVLNNAKRLGLPSRHIGVPWCQIYDIENHFKNKGFRDIELDQKINQDIIRLQNAYYTQEYNMINSKIKEIKKIIRKKEKSIKDNNIKNNTLKKKNKKGSKNKNENKQDDEDIDKILEEIQKEEEIKNKNKNIEKMKDIEKKIHDTGIGEMDVIEENKENSSNKENKEFMFHLREQIISIEYETEYEKSTNFKSALIALIIKNEEKIDKIKIISKCENLFFDTQQKYFRIFVKTNDKEQYKKIINATLLISNMILKLRETLEEGKIFFKRTAVMF